jgi:hypothetical protein
MAVEWIIAGLLALNAGILLETRITVGTKVVVLERDIQWMVAMLQKWGLVPPTFDKEP